jgi:hypothetical protein
MKQTMKHLFPPLFCLTNLALLKRTYISFFPKQAGVHDAEDPGPVDKQIINRIH